MDKYERLAAWKQARDGMMTRSRAIQYQQKRDIYLRHNASDTANLRARRAAGLQQPLPTARRVESITFQDGGVWTPGMDMETAGLPQPDAEAAGLQQPVPRAKRKIRVMTFTDGGVWSPGMDWI
tara:strand:+ start:23 stop:394 length:372 start_codon:yes stop_codon:yes gene_type:complete